MPAPDFVLHLREQVGHDLLWLIGVAGVVLDDADRVLLTLRSDNGTWATVGGILEPGEQPAVGLVREIEEETGVLADVVALAAVVSDAPMTYPNGDVAQYLTLCFWCRAVGGTAHVADDESTDVGWFPLDDLPEPITPGSLARIRWVLEHRAATDRAGHGVQPHLVLT